MSLNSRKKTIAMPGKIAVRQSEPGVAERRRVIPPGTPVRVSARRSQSKHTCPTCALPIVEEADGVQGQEAILCEGCCNAWYHRWCAGVSTARYEALSLSDEPFLCPVCAMESQQRSILDLQSTVRALSEEVNDLRAALVILQEPKDEASTETLLKELRDLKDVVAALKLQVNCPEHTDSVDSEAAQTWSEVVRRKQKGKDKGKGSGKGVGDKNGGAVVGVRKQPVAAQEGEGVQQKTQRQRQFVPLPGKRKVWGTQKACPASTVKDAITKHIGQHVSVNVKRKFKLGSDKKTVMWWHVVSGEEKTMVQLEQEWSKIRAQGLSWKIVPCLSYADHSEAPENPNPQQCNQPIVRNNADNSAKGDTGMHTVTVHPSCPSDNNNQHSQVQSTSDVDAQSSHSSVEAQHSAQTSFLDQ